MVNICWLCKEKDYRGNVYIKFHSFPSDPERRFLWLQRIQRTGFQLPKTARLCSKHFNKNDYVRGAGKRTRVLKKGALPLPHVIPTIDLESDVPEPIFDNANTTYDREINLLIPQPPAEWDDQNEESSESSSESDTDSYTSTSTSSSDYSEISNSQQKTIFVNNTPAETTNNFEISVKDFGRICRTCLAEGEMKLLYEQCHENNCLLEMLMSTTFLQVSENDGLPHQICLDCESELRKAYNFAQKCIETDKKLKNCIKNLSNSTQIAANSKTCDEVPKINYKLGNKQENIEIKTDVETEDSTKSDVHIENLILVENENVVKFEHNYCFEQNVTEENLPETENENNNDDCDNSVSQNNISDTNTNISDKINKKCDLKLKKNQIRKKTITPKTNKLKESENNGGDCDINLPQNENESDTNFNNSQNENSSPKPKKRQIRKQTPAPRKKKLQEKENCDESLQNENIISDTNLTDEINKNSDMKPKKKQVKQKVQLPRKKRIPGPPYECKKCFKTFETYNLLWLHWKEVKHPPKYGPVTCKICLKQIPYKAMNRHMRVHTLEKPYVCEVCGNKFSIKGNLDRHMKTHTGEKPHKCTYCEKAFIQLRSLRDHIRIHTGERPYCCNICGRRFTSEGFYKLHLYSRHGPKIRKPPDRSVEPQHECETCHKKFHSKAVLKTHTLIHGEKKFLCNHCGMSFFTKGRLDIHLKVHTGEKPYSCEICGKTFSQSGSLKSHILTHTGEKPYVCKICDRGFTQGQHLAYHLRTHSDEKPFSCDFCGKCFSQKCNLRIHTRIHTGETPYLCPICNKGFYDCSSMHKHKRKHEQSTA